LPFDERIGYILERERVGQPELVMQPIRAGFKGRDSHVIDRVNGKNTEYNQDKLLGEGSQQIFNR
jgi:hypothetical protein